MSRKKRSRGGLDAAEAPKTNKTKQAGPSTKSAAACTPVPGPPTILCERTPSGQLRFWCQFCRKFHLHGGASGGHRLAHCFSEAGREAYAAGYFLAVRDDRVSP